MEISEISMWISVRSVGIKFSLADPPTNLLVSVARGIKPPLRGRLVYEST